MAGTRGHIFAYTWNGVSMMSMENLERPQVMYPVLGEVVHCGRHSGSRVVSSPATPPKERWGESLGALVKFLGCADVAFSIPELPIRSTRRAFT